MRSALTEFCSKRYGGLLTSLCVLAGLLAGFVLHAEGTAFAATLVVTSEPVARGSVTPGYNDLTMQALTMRTLSDATELSQITLSELGTGNATETVSSVGLYRESNSIGGLQIGNDTLLTLSPSTFSAETTQFQLSPSATISSTASTFYIVYSLSSTATTGTTVSSNLANEGSLTITLGDTVTSFNNLRSREVTIVQTPHATGMLISPFSIQTNLCLTCHSVHTAPDFRTSHTLAPENVNKFTLTQPYFEAPSVVNASTSDISNALCLSCHDGTGSLTDIKGLYNSITVNYPGHETTSTGSLTTGYKPPPSGQSYNAGIKMPCMVCHDVHDSQNGNFAMLSDDLYGYSTSNGWVDPNLNGKIDPGDETCLVCHAYSTETARTVEILGINMIDLPVTHEDTATYSGCVIDGCHDDPHGMN